MSNQEHYESSKIFRATRWIDNLWKLISGHNKSFLDLYLPLPLLMLLRATNWDDEGEDDATRDSNVGVHMGMHS